MIEALRGDGVFGEMKQMAEMMVSSEFKLLISCLRKEQDRMDLLLAMPINWHHLLYLVRFHKVYPLVYRYLNASEHTCLPQQVISNLCQMCLENTAKTLQMAGELVTVLRVLEKNGIRAVVLKGFPLAMQLYSNVGFRPSRDIDIFVWPKNVDEARKIIEALGYHREYPSFKAIPEWPQKWMQRNHHFEYWHKKKNISIELHWKLGHYGMEIPLENVEDNLTRMNIAGQQIYTLRMEESILFLALHGASHGWFRLKWLCDMDAVLPRRDFSWERLYTLAKHLDVEPILNQAIILAREVLGTPVPEYIAKIAEKDRKAGDLASMSMLAISAADSGHTTFNRYMPSLYRQKKYEFSLQRGWEKKLAYIHSHFSPTDGNIQSIPLPDGLYFMYYFIRPCTWLTRRLSALRDNKVFF